MDNAKLKTTAKKRLQGKYSVAVLSLLLFMVLGGCCSFVAMAINSPWVSSLLMFIVDALLVMGFVGIILKISRGQNVSLDDLFTKTDLFGKYIVVTFLLGLASFIIWLLGYLSFKSLIMVIMYQVEINMFLAILLVIFGLLLTVAIIMVGAYLVIAFSQTYFILYDEPELPVFKVLEKSFDMMADYILEYFVLTVSFIGWAILGIFTFGILYLWLVPYMLVTYAIFYDKVKKSYEETTGVKGKEVPKKEVASKPKTTKAAPARKTSAKSTATKKASSAKTATAKTATAKTATVKTATAKKTTAKSTAKTTSKSTTAKKAAPKTTATKKKTTTTAKKTK